MEVRKLKLKKVKLSMSALLMVVALTACGNADKSSSESSTDSSKPKQEEISGTITAAGSTALQPLAEEAANDILAKYPNLNITVQGGGSGTGVNQVAAGAIDIGNSDVPSAEKLDDKSKADQFVDTKVAGIAFAVVVNKDVKADSLTSEQLQNIFSGKITNWKDVGGEDAKINVINRPASSGTRATFEKTIMNGVKVNDSIGTAQDTNGSVETAVNSTPGSISYLAMSYLVGDKANSLTKLKINNVDPTTENISAGKYPFWAYEYMITKGEAKGASKAFIDYIAGDDFANKVKEMGYIPVSELK
jgi:phosphate transport system substrate-binding protein